MHWVSFIFVSSLSNSFVRLWIANDLPNQEKGRRGLFKNQPNMNYGFGSILMGLGWDPVLARVALHFLVLQAGYARQFGWGI